MNNIILRENILKKVNFLRRRFGFLIDERKKYQDLNDFILEKLDIIEKELNENECKTDFEYCPSFRAYFCLREFEYELQRNNFEMCFYDILEIIEDDKKNIYGRSFEAKRYCDRYDYFYSPFISQMERMILLSKVFKLKTKILKTRDNQKGDDDQCTLTKVKENL